MTTMRILVTGRGSIAQRHVKILRSFRPDIVLGVLSVGEPTKDLSPFEWLTSWASAAAWNPQAVVIAGVSERHATELAASIEAGWPCLAEKPLVTSIEGLNAVRAACAGRKVMPPVVVGCNLRYLPSLQQAAATLRSGALGRIVRAQFEVGHDLALWRPGRDLADCYSARAAMGGGVLFDLVHEVDLARWLLGPLQVRAAIGGQLSRPLAALGLESDDVHVALLELPWGAPVTVSLDYVSRKLVRRHVLTGELGTLIWDLAARRCWIDDAQGAKVLTEDPADFDISQTYRSQMLDWLQAMGDPQHCVVSPLVDAMESAALMLAMKEAEI